MSAPAGAAISMSATRTTTSPRTAGGNSTSTNASAGCRPAESCRRRQHHQDSVPNGIPVSSDNSRRLRPSRSRRASSAVISLRRCMPARCRARLPRPDVLHATVTEGAEDHDSPRSAVPSANVRPSPSSTASCPVAFCHRLIATSTNGGLISIARHRRPVRRPGRSGGGWSGCRTGGRSRRTRPQEKTCPRAHLVTVGSRLEVGVEVWLDGRKSTVGSCLRHRPGVLVPRWSRGWRLGDRAVLCVA